MDPIILIGAIVTVVTGAILASFKYWLDRRAETRRADAEKAERLAALAAERQAAISRVELYDPRGKSPEELRRDIEAAVQVGAQLREEQPPQYAPLRSPAWVGGVFFLILLGVVVFVIVRLVS